MPVEAGEATSEGIRKLRERLGGFETEDGRIKGLNFRPRDGDVFVVTSPKCGTTWLQQIVHQLRSRGSMDFVEISEVVPWVEMAADLGQDLDADHAFSPRAFKTHCWYDHCPKGDKCKYIVVVRDPHDVAVSFFTFFEGWYFQPGEVSLEEFVKHFWLARGIPESKMQNASYFHHLISWWQHRWDDNVLFLFYEDMKADLELHVREIARFIGVDHTDKELIRLATEKSTFAFMSANKEFFDERLTKMKRNVHCGLEPGAGLGNGKVRDGKSGHGKVELPQSLAQEIDAKWMATVGKDLGCQTYEELRERLRKEREARKQALKGDV